MSSCSLSVAIRIGSRLAGAHLDQPASRHWHSVAALPHVPCTFLVPSGALPPTGTGPLGRACVGHKKSRLRCRLPSLFVSTPLPAAPPSKPVWTTGTKQAASLGGTSLFHPCRAWRSGSERICDLLHLPMLDTISPSNGKACGWPCRRMRGAALRAPKESMAALRAPTACGCPGGAPQSQKLVAAPYGAPQRQNRKAYGWLRRQKSKSKACGCPSGATSQRLMAAPAERHRAPDFATR